MGVNFPFTKRARLQVYTSPSILKQSEHSETLLTPAHGVRKSLNITYRVSEGMDLFLRRAS